MAHFAVTAPTLCFLVCMTTLAGFVDAAAGGGGLISLPAYLAAGLPAHFVYGTNKFSAACGTTFATLNFLRSGALDVPVALLAAAGSFVGSGLAAWLVLRLSDAALKLLLLAVLPVAALVILGQRKLPDTDRTARWGKNKILALSLGIGVAIGCYDGLIGPGTGTFAILAFSGVVGYSLRTASGNAKLLNLASNYASLAVYLASGLVVFPIAVPCALGNIAGNLLGSHLALKKGGRFIRPMLLVVLALLLVKVGSDALIA